MAKLLGGLVGWPEGKVAQVGGEGVFGRSGPHSCRRRVSRASGEIGWGGVVGDCIVPRWSGRSWGMMRQEHRS